MKPVPAHAKWLSVARGAALVASLGASGATQAANPPGWLNWGGGDKESTSASAQPASASTQPAAAGASDSGQSVVIQNLLNQVQDMQQEIRDLRGKIEVQNNTIQRLKSAQRDGFASLDSRMSKLEQSQSTAGGSMGSDASANQGGQGDSQGDSQAAASHSGAAAGTGSAATGSAGQSAAASAGAAATASQGASSNQPGDANAQSQQNPADAAKQEALYNKAFGLLKNGKYKAAVKGFQDVIDANPQGQWTPSALFWQGETYYVLQDRDKAEAAYQRVLKDFPKSGRVPDALLKTGYIAYDKKQNDKARKIFKQVIGQYPNSQAANLAKQRLDRMDREHR